MTRSRLHTLTDRGQSVWLDDLRRDLLQPDGRGTAEIDRLVDAGVTGLTTNPAILENAFASGDYDGVLAEHVSQRPSACATELVERVVLDQVTTACERLADVYRRTGGADGFVSLEVAPGLAFDTWGTIGEARRLWDEVGQPNLLIKIPGTEAGMRSVEALTADGIGTNVTLLFSPDAVEAAGRAYLRGLETRDARGDDLDVASVASFFVSRIDVAVDAALDALEGHAAREVRGRTALAVAAQALDRARDLFTGSRWDRLADRGARAQRTLWASTSMKDPDRPDTAYLAALAAAGTITTVPPETLRAFRDHGDVPDGAAEVEHAGQADGVMDQLQTLGIDLDRVLSTLKDDGIDAFVGSAAQLESTVAGRRAALLGGAVSCRATRARAVPLPASAGALEVACSPDLALAVEDRLGAWADDDVATRLWQKDPTVWSPDGSYVAEVGDRLGWLTLPESMRDVVPALDHVAGRAWADGLRSATVLGMGGSSLAPEVFGATFPAGDDALTLSVLDSTHPEAVRAMLDALDPETALFVVSSKSGTTAETLAFFRAAWAWLGRGGIDDRGSRFVAVTDPGTPLEALAFERGFRSVCRAPAEVGGRYAALTTFGLLPAALGGVDVAGVLASARGEAERTRRTDTGAAAVRLGAFLAEAAMAGRDKLTLACSPALAALPVWTEQLVAESLGKDGTGIVPVEGEPLGPPEVYGDDRLFVWMRTADEADDPALDALAEAGHAVVRMTVPDAAGLGALFFRWEVAVALAGRALGVNPFDQPDVEAAKEAAREALAGDAAEADDAISTADVDALASAVADWLAPLAPGDVAVIHAYLPPGDAGPLADVRGALRKGRRIATTLGIGPRFLHSTGQLHKGGPDGLRVLQIVDRPGDDLDGPDGATFGDLLAAQADGDARALREADREVLRVRLEPDRASGLNALTDAVAMALGDAAPVPASH